MISLSTPPHMGRTFALLLVPLAFTARAELTTLETVELKYRTAAEVLPVVEPLVRGEGSVTGTQNLLFVRTTPENLAEVRRVLAAIDTLPRRLQITVLQNLDRATRDRLLAAGGGVSSGDAAMELPNFPRRRGRAVESGRGDVSLRGQGLEREARESDRLAQHIHTLDGSPAFIVTGQPEADSRRRVVRAPFGERVEESASDQDLESGLYVLPRLSGEHVTLEISIRRGRAGPPGAGDLQTVPTVATGWLGEWIDVGVVLQGHGAARSGVGSAGSSSGSGLGTMLLRVEEIR